MSSFGSTLLIILGLCVFEIINSVDNAVINAEILNTVSKRVRKWFLFWGLFFAVIVVRGMLPWILIWITNPTLGPMGALTATWNENVAIQQSLEKSAPFLLVAAGTFLIFLFAHWLFLEPKHHLFDLSKFFEQERVWFYAVVSVILVIIIQFAIRINKELAVSAAGGAALFFVIEAFKKQTEKAHHKLLHEQRNLSDWSKIIYLEIIDASLSIDGVLGAFAFTLSVPLILIGNGIGAIVVRQITIGNIGKIHKYKYLKNGAMYSLFFLGIVMLLTSYGIKIPEWLAPSAIIFMICFSLYVSRNKNGNHAINSF